MRSREMEKNATGTGESLWDVQEAGRQLADKANVIAAAMRRTPEEMRIAVKDSEEALAELKILAQQQRVVLDRQDKALERIETRSCGF